MSSTSPWLVFSVLGAMILLFAYGRWRYDVVALAGLLTLTVAGAIPPSQAFQGLGHPAVLTVAAVLVLAAGLVESGAAEILTGQFARVARRGSSLAPVLGLGVTLLSAVINNVGALSLLMPVGRSLGVRYGVPPSRYLMVLAFGSILGGLLLLISTPVNLIVSGFREDRLGQGYGLFAFLPVGAAVAALGLIYLLTVGSWLLPVRVGAARDADLFEVGSYCFEVLVTEECALAGESIGHSPAFANCDVIVASIVRGADVLLAPGPANSFETGDRLIVEAMPDRLARFVRETGAQLCGPTTPEALQGASVGVRLLEAVVTPEAALVGKTVREIQLRQHYGINLLAVARQGARIATRPADTCLRAGDIVLVQGPVSGAARFFKEQDCLPLAPRELSVGRGGHPLTATLIFSCSIMLAAAWLPVQIAFALGALMMVVTRQLRVQQAYDALELPILVLLACVLPIGHALQDSGGAALLAGLLTGTGSRLPPHGVLALFITMTALLANSMNNKAAAALMAPVGLELARTLHSNPDPFLMGTAVGAELVFLSPLGHQSNLLILGAAGYRLVDFVRVGGPLLLLLLMAASLLIPIVWPL